MNRNDPNVNILQTPFKSLDTLLRLTSRKNNSTKHYTLKSPVYKGQPQITLTTTKTETSTPILHGHDTNHGPTKTTNNTDQNQHPRPKGMTNKPHQNQTNKPKKKQKKKEKTTEPDLGPTQTHWASTVRPL